MITYILHPSYFCEIWALCVSWIIMTTCIYILLCLTYLSKKLIVALSKTSNTVAIICRKTLYPKKCSFKKKTKKKTEENLMALFLWMTFNCLQSHCKEKVFTFRSPEVSGTHLINLERMKSWVNLGAIQWLWAQNPWIVNCILFVYKIIISRSYSSFTWTCWSFF